MRVILPFTEVLDRDAAQGNAQVVLNDPHRFGHFAVELAKATEGYEKLLQWLLNRLAELESAPRSSTPPATG